MPAARAEVAAVQPIIAFQHNPDTLMRSLQVKGVGMDNGYGSEALRLKGLPVQSIKLDAEIHARKGRNP
jgi:hypothetical protein